jgi:hypothetical protein
MSLLVSWYAFGWVAVAMWCRLMDELRLAPFLVFLAAGPIAAWVICPWSKHDPVVWRRKP